LWSSEKIGEALNDKLPSFSLAPQEYVTKIGQYLMTLAHHLEPYLSQENPSIKRFIKTFSNENLTVESPEQVVRCWLNYTSSSICKLYMSAIFDFKDLSRSGAKQLWVDIDYLKNVLSDIGIDLDNDLSIFAKVLSQMDEIESNNGKFCSNLFSSFEDAKKIAEK
uniref:Conserved oligomeric Golgi complex subunit 7 n=1 Tax=Romanomermis culicivorax TaxID=13658 RepID=A0A915KRP8_ROMCU